MDNILKKLRILINDELTTVSDIFVYDNSSTFTLTEENVESVDEVYVNDETSGVTSNVSSNLKKVSITSSLNEGDIVRIDSSVYKEYSDNELKGYIQAALFYLSVNNYHVAFDYDEETDDIYPAPETKEENLIAMIASLIINKPINSLRLPDVSITYPNTMPLEERISKTIAKFKKDGPGIFYLA